MDFRLKNYRSPFLWKMMKLDLLTYYKSVNVLMFNVSMS